MSHCPPARNNLPHICVAQDPDNNHRRPKGGTTLLYLVGSRAGGARTCTRRVLALKRIMWREIFPRYRQGDPPRKERGQILGIGVGRSGQYSTFARSALSKRCRVASSTSSSTPDWNRWLFGTPATGTCVVRVGHSHGGFRPPMFQTSYWQPLLLESFTSCRPAIKRFGIRVWVRVLRPCYFF